MGFDGKIGTPTRPNGSRNDNAPPNCGSLSLKDITSLGALAGTHGSDVLLLHGDRDLQITGSENTRITVNRTETVFGNEETTIRGNKTEMVIGNNAQTTVGDLHRTSLSTTSDTYVGKHTIEHKEDQQMNESQGHYHNLTEKWEKANVKIDDWIEYQLHAIGVQNFIVSNLDIKGFQNAAIGLLAEKHFSCAAEKDVEVQLKQLHTQIAELKSEVGAIEPVVYITKVHEVSITQKLIVIGINQFM